MNLRILFSKPTLTALASIVGLSSSLTMQAAEISLPALTQISCHPDGSLASVQVPLAAGQHRLRLPDLAYNRVIVHGCSWRLGSGVDALPAPALPAEAIPFIAERNALALKIDAHTRLRAAHEVVVAQLQNAAPLALAAEHNPLPTLRSYVEQRAALDAENQELRRTSTALTERARVIGFDNPAWLDVPTFERPTSQLAVSEAQARWQGLAAAPVSATSTQPTSYQYIDVQCAEACTIDVTLALPITWTASTTLNIHDGKATWTQQAIIHKPLGMEVAAPAVTLYASLRDTPDFPPTIPHVRISTEPVVRDQQRSIIQTTTGVALGASSSLSESVANAASLTLSTPAAPPQNSPPAESEAMTEPIHPAIAVRWHYDMVTLAAGITECTVQQPPLTTAIASDEWVVIPAISTVAIRRIVATTPNVPLLAGDLTVYVDGKQRGQGWRDLTTANSTLEICADEDPSIFVTPSIPWDIDPHQQTSTRQRSGSFTTLHALGTTPKTIIYYAPIPRSTSADMAITIDPQSTVGFTVSPEGYVRWELQLKGNDRRDINLGYTITAKGGLSL